MSTDGRRNSTKPALAMGRLATQPAIEVIERVRPDVNTRPETPISKRRRSQLPPPLTGPDIIIGPSYKCAETQPEFVLPKSISSKIMNKRRDSSHSFSKDAKNAGKDELQDVVPAVGKAIEREVDPVTIEYLIMVLREAARKGCSINDAFPAIGRCLEISQPTSIVIKALKTADHAVDSDQNISPLLGSILELLAYPETNAMASDILKKFVSKDPSNALQMKHAIDISRIHRICTKGLLEQCEKMIHMGTVHEDFPAESDSAPAEKGKPTNTRYAISNPQGLDDDLENPAGKNKKAKPKQAEAGIKSSTKHPKRMQGSDPAGTSMGSKAHPSDHAKFDDACISNWASALSSEERAIRNDAIRFFERNLDNCEMARFILPILPNADQMALLKKKDSGAISESVETIRKRCCELLHNEYGSKKTKNP